MGLDMYLVKKTHVGNKWKKADELVKVIGLPSVKSERLFEVVEEVGYWRKANAVHQWFVNRHEEFENGNEVYVDMGELNVLLQDCSKVLASSKLITGKNGRYIEDPTVAQELLPTQDGFFFGSQDYDEYYLDDIKLTKKICEEAIAEGDKEGSFYYTANW